MTQFNREAFVTIGEVGGVGFTIKDLRISFEVSKTLDKEPNKAEIKIYNLSEESRNNIKELGERVFLNAGYIDGDGADVLFIGNVTLITHKIEKPEVITIIRAQDGQKSLNSVRAALSFSGGTSAKLVLSKIIELFPNAANTLGITVPDKQYFSGFSFSGNASEALDKVTKFLGLEWSFQNDELKFIPLDGNDGTRIVVLKPSTGLIGSPERRTNENRKSKGKSKRVKPGWEVNALLQPKIQPGGKIGLESREIPPGTDYTVIEVVHTGDTHGADWNSRIIVNE